MKFRCCVLDFFQLSYFADVDLLLPRPNLGANTALHGITGRISWYDFKPSLSGWNSWLLAGLVNESWRHWTGYFVICKCCCYRAGVLWYNFRLKRFLLWLLGDPSTVGVSRSWLPNIGMHHRSYTSHWCGLWTQNRHNETNTTRFILFINTTVTRCVFSWRS